MAAAGITRDTRNPEGATRRSGPGKDALFPNPSLTLDQLLAGDTPNNAYLKFMEKQIGTLEPGRLADVIVFS